MALSCRWPAGMLVSAAVLWPAGSANSLDPGDLAALRAEALALVNEAREEHGLPALVSREALAAAAQSHAEDMARRDYYGHASPEGETVSDRYRSAGGSGWELVAENISRCADCGTQGTELVREFQRGWMESPGHRENILAEGLTGFGFGIAAEGERVLAVQTFAGPGTADGDSGEILSADQQQRRMLDAVNRQRRDAGHEPLFADEALTELARTLAETGTAERPVAPSDELQPIIDRHSAGWSRLRVLVAACGGCGRRAVEGDIERFLEQWLANPQYRDTLLGAGWSRLGFLIRADGEGRKVALAVVGEPG